MRAVFYCRVSTDEESQLNALENQIREARNCIAALGWELIDGYIDEGKSGTSTKKRNEYKRLFEDLESDRFDVLVIKSQDRLMRNVREWYIFIDVLVTNEKKLYFYLESKFYTPEDALITGIKAILAEEYSRDLSKKIRNAHKNRQEKGESVLITSATWGYDKIKKEVVINEEEAEIVRMIYSLCLQGYGSRTISKILSNQGILSRTGKHFPDTTIRRIIRNPLFKGTAVMNRKSTDFYTKRSVNNSEDEWRYHENAVPAIVTPEIWDSANKIMDERLKEMQTDNFKKKMLGKNKGRYDLSSKIFCGICGSVYWRRYRRGYKNKDEIITGWSCSEYVRRGRNKARADKKEVVMAGSGCDNVHIKEADLLSILSEIAKSILQNKKESVIKHAMKIIEDVLDNSNVKLEVEKNRKDKEKILTQKNLLLDKLLAGTITDSDYKRKASELEKTLGIILDDEKVMAQNESAYMDMQGRLIDIEAALNEIDMGEAEALRLIRHIDKMIIFTDRIEIYFDFLDKVSVDISEESTKKYLYADADKYLAAVYNQESKTGLRD